MSAYPGGGTNRDSRDYLPDGNIYPKPQIHCTILLEKKQACEKISRPLEVGIKPGEEASGSSINQPTNALQH
jgi:hypothetical protein